MSDTPILPGSGYRSVEWWHRIDEKRVQCDLCPRDCRLHAGQRGACFVRAYDGETMVLTTWGRSSGFCIDPIEKKPLNHFHPGSRILSFGTAGCNLACKFCQNWDISKSRDMDRLMDQASPAAIARAAQSAGADSVAFTYNDPVIFYEYAIDVAEACHEAGLDTVAVTAGYIHEAPREIFFHHMDATNVDLKAFTDEFYVRQCGARLAPVLDTLKYIRHDTNCWLEITTLLIPGLNDSEAEIAALSAWVFKELGSEVPLHFTAFHPDWKLTDRPATPAATLSRARRQALDAGLKHVYTGNVRDLAGGTTHCSQCGEELIVRDGYAIRSYHVGSDGICPSCGSRLAGRFGDYRGSFGNRRIPIVLAAP